MTLSRTAIMGPVFCSLWQVLNFGFVSNKGSVQFLRQQIFQHFQHSQFLANSSKWRIDKYLQGNRLNFFQHFNAIFR